MTAVEFIHLELQRLHRMFDKAITDLTPDLLHAAIVLGIVAVAQHKQQGADQFIAQVVEHAQQAFRRRENAIVRLCGQTGFPLLVKLGHNSTVKDEKERSLDWPVFEKNRTGSPCPWQITCTSKWQTPGYSPILFDGREQRQEEKKEKE